MNMRPPEPFDDEERALAALISREGPHGEPSAALDAKILAAARAAVAPPARTRPRRPRWPVLTGVAASALLAVGIAWQMRPAHETAPLAGNAEAPAPMDREARMSGPSADAPAADAAAPIAAEVASVPPPPAQQAVSPAQEPQPQELAPEPRAFAVTPPPPPALSTPSPAPAPVAAAPATDAFTGVDSAVSDETSAATVEAAPPAFARQRVATNHERETAAAGLLEKRAEEPRAQALKSLSGEHASPVAAPPAAPGAEAASVAETPADDTLLETVVLEKPTGKPALAAIPIEEDTRLSRRKWLERIEQRRAQGDSAGARDSLHRFIGKYPRAELPPALHELLDE